jgi:hypothetical protein
MLRLWQIQVDGELVWRASLEVPHSRQRQGFASLADLFAFLDRKAGEAVQDQTALDVDGEGGDDRQRKQSRNWESRCQK